MNWTIQIKNFFLKELPIYQNTIMKLSIVILNWNGKLLLKKFLPNIILYTPNTPIYVVDNASKDDSMNFLKKNIKMLNN